MKVVLAALLLARVAADNTFDYDDDSGKNLVRNRFYVQCA